MGEKCQNWAFPLEEKGTAVDFGALSPLARGSLGGCVAAGSVMTLLIRASVSLSLN